jgi:hypothetical protein
MTEYSHLSEHLHVCLFKLSVHSFSICEKFSLFLYINVGVSKDKYTSLTGEHSCQVYLHILTGLCMYFVSTVVIHGCCWLSWLAMEGLVLRQGKKVCGRDLGFLII